MIILSIGVSCGKIGYCMSNLKFDRKCSVLYHVPSHRIGERGVHGTLCDITGYRLLNLRVDR